MQCHAARQPQACGLLVFAIVDLPLALLQLGQSLLVVENFGGNLIAIPDRDRFGECPALTGPQP